MEKKNTSETNNMKKTEMEFGVRIATHSILKELNKDGGHQTNLVLSPLSLHICLNLIAAGAKGQTLDQLLQFLNAENVAHLNAQSSRFMELVSPEPELEPKPFFGTPSRGKGPIISMVNGIWVDQRYSLKHSFELVADDVYKAGCESVDFNKAEQVANEINAWAKKASKGHIDDVVSPDSLKGAALVLANALYFKGSWIETFEPSDTKDEYFRLLNRKRVRVPFMKQWHTYTHYKSFEDFKLVRMGYKTGEDSTNYAMYIFLPDRHDGLPELVQKFHSDPGFFARNHELRYIELRKLWLPKLKFDYRLDVAENIKELGLDLPFDGVETELTEIVDEDDLYVSNISQKSYIELNEEGTVAASVTYATCYATGLGSMMRKPPSIDFVADHPFLFMIKEEISGTVLFVGAALNPLQ